MDGNQNVSTEHTILRSFKIRVKIKPKKIPQESPPDIKQGDFPFYPATTYI
jgi:hypothetical protein